jgi:hypothetical protein
MAIEIQLDQLRPNNWYLNKQKLDRVREAWRNGRADDLPPVTVTCIDGQWSLVDGHSRAFVAWENGSSRILAVVEEVRDLEEPHKVYEYLHARAPEQGICKIRDLQSRILESEAYEQEWLGLRAKLDL